MYHEKVDTNETSRVCTLIIHIFLKKNIDNLLIIYDE
jgi:hypothetical protein